MSWVTVLAGSLVCYALKLAGYLVPGSWLARERVQQVVGLLPVGLLASLAGIQTLTDADGAWVVDARLLGVGVGILALALRAPFLVVVAAAAATAAFARATGLMA